MSCASATVQWTQKLLALTGIQQSQAGALARTILHRFCLCVCVDRRQPGASPALPPVSHTIRHHSTDSPPHFECNTKVYLCVRVCALTSRMSHLQINIILLRRGGYGGVAVIVDCIVLSARVCAHLMGTMIFVCGRAICHNGRAGEQTCATRIYRISLLAFVSARTSNEWLYYTQLLWIGVWMRVCVCVCVRLALRCYFWSEHIYVKLPTRLENA